MPNTSRTEDNEEFSTEGSSPSQIRQLLWEGLPGVYMAAADGGLLKTVDYGAGWGSLRPNTEFATTWPAGAVGYQMATAVGPRQCGNEETLWTFRSDPSEPIHQARLYEINKDRWKSLLENVYDDNSETQMAYRGNKGFYQESNSGLLVRTLNAGGSWDTLEAAEFSNEFHGAAIGPRPGGGDRFWISQPSSQKIYYSDDDGLTWTLSFTNPISGHTPEYICPHPTNPNKVVVVTDGGSPFQTRVIYTIDAGVNWSGSTPVVNVGRDRDGGWHAAWMTQNNDRLVLAYGGDCIDYSDDDGATWTNVESIVGSPHANSAIVYGGGSVFLGYRRYDHGTRSVIRRSADGITWTDFDFTTPPQLECHGLKYTGDKLYALMMRFGIPTDWRLYVFNNPLTTWDIQTLAVPQPPGTAPSDYELLGIFT